MRALEGILPWLKPALRSWTLSALGLAGGVVCRGVTEMGWLCSCVMFWAELRASFRCSCSTAAAVVLSCLQQPHVSVRQAQHSLAREHGAMQGHSKDCCSSRGAQLR